ncbi:hypothetical protein [Amycolatopsis kentuckyensis]|uniref:hypothetical protein n=1 Tax=Amycolatopsis kentuckyensis TaxID=218823 RepID=UPI0035630BB5
MDKRSKSGKLRRIIVAVALTIAVIGVIAPASSGQEPADTTTTVLAGGGGGGNTGN